MGGVLICSSRDFKDELGRTVLWRQDMEHFHALGTGAAIQIARVTLPDIILVDGDLGEAKTLVATLRSHPQTRHLPIAVIVKSGADPRGLPFLEAGANEVLALPARPDWDERLLRLFRLPGRSQVRCSFRVDVEVEGKAGPIAGATALNLSSSGMLLRCEGLAVGEHLRLSFPLPGFAQRTTGAGWVVREAATTQFGVQFLYLEGDGLGRVRRVVDTWVDT